MATELAKAYVQIIPSAQGISGKIQQAIEPDAEVAGTSFGGKLVGKIKGVIATAAIGKALASTISEGAALEQSLGGIETLFKDSADKVKANAAKAYQTAGMSANDYMELTTSFSASLLSSLAGDTSKAADVADMAMVDMSDNANKMGTNMEDIKNAYQGFAKQNYTMLDNLKLGYGGTKSEMERLLADAQKISGVEYNIDNLSDVYSAIHVIQGELDITGTTAKEASTTISGSFNSLKAAAKNVMGQITLGMDVGPALNQLATTLVTFAAGNLIPAIWNIVSALPTAIITFISALGPQLFTVVSELIPQIVNGISTGIPALYASAMQLIGQFNTGIQEQLPTLLQKGVDFVANITNGILQNLPQIIAMAGHIITYFANTIISSLPTILSAGASLLLKLVNGIINNLPQIVQAAATAIVRFVGSIGRNLPQILQSGITIIGKLAAGLIRAIPNLVGQIPAVIGAIVRTFGSENWGSIGLNIIKGIASGLSSAAHMLWDAVKSVLGSFKDNVLSFFGIHSPSRWGVFVGKMIDAGVANGLIDNTSLISNAANELQRSLKEPFKASADLITGSTVANSEKDSILSAKLEQLLEYLKQKSRGSDKIVINMNDREVARALREMGVVFE
ncbi:phage tail protein [Coprococcus comes]|uniref:phage tail protein n=1 Tax=Coprococcus comes TaxID=410072 RepID=UPI003D7BEDE8